MTANKISKLVALSMLFVLGWTIETEARQRNYGSRGAPRQSAGISFSFPDFSQIDPSCLSSDEAGNCTVLQDESFSDPIYSIFYSKPGIFVSVGRGTQESVNEDGTDLEILQTVIQLSGALRPFPALPDAKTQLVVPVALHSGYRRLSADASTGSFDRFESTVLALGIGVGLLHETGSTRISAHVIPFFGLASSSFGFGSGTSSLLDAGVELTVGPISGEIGITLGYSFRWQKWDLAEQFGNDQNFIGKQHGIRIGVNW